jgi:hypothetical protein
MADMKKPTAPALSLLLLLAAPACSREILAPQEATASSTGASTASSTGAGAGGAGGTGGGGGMGGGGGAPSCVETYDSMSVALVTWDGKTFGCGADAGDYELSARLVNKPVDGLFVLDSCSPSAVCKPQLSTLSITVTDSSYYAEINDGAYVKVHFAIEPLETGGCRQRIQIKNLPTWDGVTNPVDPGERLWFFGADGGLDTFPDTPVVVTKEALDCVPPGQAPACGAQDYDLRFRPAGDASSPGVLVPMGKQGYLVPGSETYGGLEIRNLRSSTSACEPIVNLAYRIKYHFPGD